MKWYYLLLLCEEQEKLFLNGTSLVTYQYCDMHAFKSRFWVFNCEKKNSCKYCWILHIGQTSIRLLGSCFKVSLANTEQSEQHWGLAFVSMMEDIGRNSWSPNGQVGIAHLHLPGLFNYTWLYHSALKCIKTGSLSWIL